MAQHKNRILSRKEAAFLLTQHGLTIAPQTLARLFSEGRGPLCIHMGRRAKYKESDLLAYLLTQTSAPRRSSSEPLRPIDPNDLPLAANDADNDAGNKNEGSQSDDADQNARKNRRT